MIHVLHVADLHMDAPFGFLGADKARTMQNELRFALGSIVRIVKERQVDLVLIPGDLVDHSYVSGDTSEALKKAFAEMSCPVVIAPGNHDPYTESGFWNVTTWPENVCLFSSEKLTSFSFDTLRTDVYGYAFESEHMNRSPLAGARAPEDGRIHLACIHANVGSGPSTYAAITPAEVDAFGATYVALGHIHLTSEPKIYDGRGYAYSGAAVGHSSDETGSCGALLIAISEEGRGTIASVERLPISKYHFETVELDISECKTSWEVYGRWKDLKASLQLDDYTLMTVRLTGTSEPGLLLDKTVIEDEETNWFSLKVEDCSELKQNRTELVQDQTIRGEFYRSLQSQLDAGDERSRQTAELALKYGLAALDGNLSM